MNDISSTEPLRVVVQWRRPDLLAAQFHFVLRRYLWLLLFVVCASICVWQLFRDRTPVIDAIFVVSVVMTAALFTLGGILFAYINTSIALLLRLRRSPGALGEHTFEIDDGGLRELSDAGEIRVAPGYVRRLLRTRRAFIVFVSPRRSFVVPRRHFADLAADEAFWKALKSLQGSTRRNIRR